MKNILIVSSTKNSNFDLSNEIKSFLDKKDDITSSVISLEEFESKEGKRPHTKMKKAPQHENHMYR